MVENGKPEHTSSDLEPHDMQASIRRISTVSRALKIGRWPEISRELLRRQEAKLAKKLIIVLSSQSLSYESAK